MAQGEARGGRKELAGKGRGGPGHAREWRLGCRGVACRFQVGGEVAWAAGSLQSGGQTDGAGGEAILGCTHGRLSSRRQPAHCGAASVSVLALIPSAAALEPSSVQAVRSTPCSVRPSAPPHPPNAVPAALRTVSPTSRPRPARSGPLTSPADTSTSVLLRAFFATTRAAKRRKAAGLGPVF